MSLHARAFWLVTVFTISGCQHDPAATAATQWEQMRTAITVAWQKMAHLFGIAPPPPDFAAQFAQATDLISTARNELANDQLESARTALAQLQQLKNALPTDLQQEIARLDAMLADQLPHSTPSTTSTNH